MQISNTESERPLLEVLELAVPEQVMYLLCREAAAVARFLAEAVSLLLRKPHEMWELQQDILDTASGNGSPLHQPDASLLPITALRQAIRVAGSSKMSETAIVAICRYVEGAAAFNSDWLHTSNVQSASEFGRCQDHGIASRR